MRRIFIENDEKIDFQRLQTLARLHERDFDFDFFYEDAMFNGPEVLQGIIEADEIYIDSALIGNSFVLFQNMVYACQQKKITGKKLFIFRTEGRVHFNGIEDEGAFNEVFDGRNELYCQTENDDTNVYGFELCYPKK